MTKIPSAPLLKGPNILVTIILLIRDKKIVEIRVPKTLRLFFTKDIRIPINHL